MALTHSNAIAIYYVDKRKTVSDQLSRYREVSMAKLE